MMSALQTVIDALAGRRFPLEDEKATQAAIHEALLETFGGRVFRETRVCSGVIDFLVVDDPAAIGIEVKLKGQPAAIRRQVNGYASEPAIAALLLVTAKPIAMPRYIASKPVAVLDLGRAWL